MQHDICGKLAWNWIVKCVLMKKIPKKYTPVVFSLYMAAIMAFLMSAVLVAVNTGLAGDYIWRVVRAYVIAGPIAFFCILVVRPLVQKLCAWTVEH